MRKLVFVLVPVLAGCADMGTYTPGIQHGGTADASIGSHLSGVDTSDGTTATANHPQANFGGGGGS